MTYDSSRTTYESRQSFSLVHVIGKFGVAIEFKFVDIVATFLDEKTKDVNWLLGESIQTLESEVNLNDRIPFTLKFHLHNHAVKSIILKNFKLLQNDSETGTIFSQPPLISFKRDKNIGNFLVRSSFQTNDQSGTFKCTRSRCQTVVYQDSGCLCKSIHPGKCERGKIIKETCTVCTVVVRLRGCLLWHTSSFLDTTQTCLSFITWRKCRYLRDPSKTLITLGVPPPMSFTA